MHTVHVTEAWNGGVSTYINTLLREQVEQTHISGISLIYDPAKATRDFDRGFYESVGIELIAYNSSRNPMRFWSIAQALKDKINALCTDAPMIVHLHSTFPGVYGRIISGPWKSVYCAHGWSFVQEDGLLKKTAYGLIEKILAKRCDCIINISAHEHECAKQAGIKPPVMVPVLSGVKNRPLSQHKAAFTPDPARLNFGFIGRLDHKKGFDLLAKIFARPDMAAHQLYVIGAADRDGVGAHIPAAPNIHYVGWVEHEAIDANIQALDAIIAPSRQEGFGLTVIEAMRNKRPAIVSNCGGLPELISDGQDGFIFDLEKAETDLPALINSLSRPQLSEMGKAARKHYEDNFTARRFAQDILRVYESLF